MSEAGLSGVVASFDGDKPGGADREADSGMEVADEGLHAGEVIGAACCERNGGGAGRGFHCKRKTLTVQNNVSIPTKCLASTIITTCTKRCINSYIDVWYYCVAVV